jgi:hypothetical protein
MEQEVVLDVKVKNQSLKQQLREAVLEAQALQDRFGATSKEAVAAAKKVANIKEEISDMNQVFKVFNPEEKFNAVIGVAQGIAGGFQAVTGAMQMFGTESKEVEKALLKVQAASAFAEGLNNIRSLGDSFGNLKLMIVDGIRSLGTLRGALIATGVGGFAVAIGLIVSNWKELVGWIDKTFPALGGIEKLFDNIKKVAFGTLGSIVEGFKVVGEVIGNVFTGEFSKAIDTARTFGARVSQAYTKGYKEEEQKLADERAALKLEQGIKQHERDLKLIEAQGKDTYAFKRKLLNEELELLKLQNKKETDEYKNKYNEIQILDAQHKKTLADQAQKDFEERKKKNNDFFNEVELIDTSLKTKQEQIDARLKDQKEKDIKAAEEAMKKQAELSEIYAKTEEENAQRRIDNQIKIRDASIEMAQQTLNGLISLAEIGIKNEKKLEQFRKAAALVQIGIDTAKAISAAVAAASQTSITPVDLAVKIATSVATILANIAKAKQLLSSSSTSATPSLTTVAPSTSTSATSAGGGVPMQQGPAQQGQTIANANLINNAMNNQNMIRAVVVETDITDSQRRVRGIEDRATFG